MRRADHTAEQPFASRRRARDEKRDAVLQTAVQLFLAQGYHRVTLADVADRLNITKPALYNYFRSKEDILFECYAIGQERVDAAIADIDRARGSGLAKLRNLAHAYATCMAEDYGASLVRFDMRDLSEANRKIIRAGKRSIDGAFRSYIAEGIADGSIKPCDPKMTAFAIAGSLNWIGHWFKPNGEMTANEIAKEFVAQLTKGLAARQSKTSTAKKRDATLARAETTRRGDDEYHARTAARVTGQPKRPGHRVRRSPAKLA